VGEQLVYTKNLKKYKKSKNVYFCTKDILLFMINSNVGLLESESDAPAGLQKRMVTHDFVLWW